jgi:hypothetical protein
MTNPEYLEKMKGLVDVYEHFGGEPGVNTSRVDAILIDTAVDIANPTAGERAHAVVQARETYMATMLLSKSDPKRYGALLADIENKHTRGVDAYPNTLSTAYDMLINYRTPPTSRFQSQDGGLSLYNEGHHPLCFCSAQFHLSSPLLESVQINKSRVEHTQPVLPSVE